MTDHGPIDPMASAAERRNQLLRAIQSAGGTWDRRRASELYSPRPAAKFVRTDLQRLCRAGLLLRVRQGEYQAVDA